MKAAKVFSAAIYLLVCMPIGFYIQYSILSAINADRLLWFLFWFNLPFSVLMSMIIEFVKIAEKK